MNKLLYEWDVELIYDVCGRLENLINSYYW